MRGAVDGMGDGDVKVVGSVERGVCGSDDSKHAVSVQGHAYVQLIGWQNTWLPASPPPLPRPNGGGQPWPCACAHGPKKIIIAMITSTTA